MYSEQVPWAAIVTALATLAGVAITLWHSRTAERQRRTAEGRTRFHEERMGTYAKFLSSARTVVFNGAGINMAKEEPEFLSVAAPAFADRYSDAVQELQANDDALRLIASSPVREQSKRIIWLALRLGEGRDGEDDWRTIRANFDQAVETLIQLMRHELGVETI